VLAGYTSARDSSFFTVMAGKTDVEWDDAQVRANIEALMPSIKDAVFQLFTYWSQKGASEMRSNARWTDRTGNARQGLSASVFDSEDEIALVFFHRVTYGIWLEIRWSGRYAIIGPTMASIAPQLAQQVATVMLKLRSRGA
jgi:hypothetical protein